MIRFLAVPLFYTSSIQGYISIKALRCLRLSYNKKKILKEIRMFIFSIANVGQLHWHKRNIHYFCPFLGVYKHLSTHEFTTEVIIIMKNDLV